MLFLQQDKLHLVPSLGSLSWQSPETFFQAKGKGRRGRSCEQQLVPGDARVVPGGSESL